MTDNVIQFSSYFDTDKKFKSEADQFLHDLFQPGCDIEDLSSITTRLIDSIEDSLCVYESLKAEANYNPFVSALCVLVHFNTALEELEKLATTSAISKGMFEYLVNEVTSRLKKIEYIETIARKEQP